MRRALEVSGKMTILDELVFIEGPQYHYLTGEYMGIKGEAKVSVECNYLITKEAIVRKIEEIQRQINQKKCRENIKTILLQHAMDIIESEHYVAVEPKLKEVAGFQVPVVIIKEAKKPVLIVPPKDYVPLLRAMEKYEEEMRKKALEELAFGQPK